MIVQDLCRRDVWLGGGSCDHGTYKLGCGVQYLDMKPHRLKVETLYDPYTDPALKSLDRGSLLHMRSRTISREPALQPNIRPNKCSDANTSTCANNEILLARAPDASDLASLPDETFNPPLSSRKLRLTTMCPALPPPFAPILAMPVPQMPVRLLQSG